MACTEATLPLPLYFKLCGGRTNICVLNMQREIFASEPMSQTGVTCDNEKSVLRQEGIVLKKSIGRWIMKLRSS